MINDFSSYIISIIGIIFVGVLAEVIIPNGKMHSVVKTTTAIFTILCIIKPFKSFDFSNYNFFTTSLYVDSSFVQNYEEEKTDKLIEDIEISLKNSGFSNVKIRVEKDEKKLISSIYVDLTKLVLTSENLNINKYTNIMAIIKQFVNISGENIYFYEW